MIPNMRRRVTAVTPGPAQTTLFGPCEPIAPPARKVFADPSPHALTVGRTSLEDYLRSSKQTHVFFLRDVIRSLDYETFLARYPGGGRPPYHPALMLGLVLYSILKGVDSLRGIERVAKSDVCSWWLTGGVSPDHSSIGLFLNRHKEDLSGSMFEQVTKAVLRAIGASDRPDLGGDGTTIESAAARYQKLTAEAAKKKAAEARRAAKSAPKSKKALLERKARTLETAAETADKRTKRRQADRGANTEVPAATVSPTDPDSTYQKLKDGTLAHSFKPVVFANRERVITSQVVVSSNENAAIDRLCDQSERVFESNLDCVRLDAGFSNGSVLNTLLAHGVDDILVTDRAVAADERGKSKSGSNPQRFTKGDFVYDPDEDAYTCPAGHLLKRRSKRQEGPRGRGRYSGAPCKDCPLRAHCTNSKEGRVIRRIPDDEVREAMRQVLKHPAARSNYAMRSAMVEPVFADLRQIQNLRRFRRRSLANVRLEFSLHAMAHNLGRALAVLGAAAGLLIPALPSLFSCLGRLVPGARDVDLSEGCADPRWRDLARPLLGAA